MCGHHFSFGADGLGSVDDRAFIWRISESGRLVISMIDGTGSIELTKQVAYSDGVVSVLSRVYTETESYFYDSLAVKVDSIGLAEAISSGRFENTPLSSGLFVTDPFVVRNASGIEIETWGFELNADGSLSNFDTLSYPALSRRFGEWTEDAGNLELDYCWQLRPLGQRQLTETVIGSTTMQVTYSRTWQLLSVEDLDGDDKADRLYAIESLRLFIGNCDLASQVFGRSPDECVYGKLLYAEYFGRVNFYDRRPGYDLEDLDGDGVLNIDDFAPLDDLEAFDRDEDGVGDNADQFPDDPSGAFDNDGDGISDRRDNDDDNDGVADSEDAFPYDPSESEDTDGDGIGNIRDQDDDNDGIPDSVDDSPQGIGYLDDDGDGVINRDDYDDDNDNTPDIIQALLSGSSDSLALVVRSPGFDGTDPDFATGWGYNSLTLLNTGQFVAGYAGGRESHVRGEWVWNADQSSLIIKDRDPQTSYPILSEDVYSNIDWARYQNDGYPQVEVESLGTTILQITDPGPRATSWIVSAQYGSVARVADERSPYLLDPSLPIFETDPSSEPATEQLLITDASNLRSQSRRLLEPGDLISQCRASWSSAIPG